MGIPLFPYEVSITFENIIFFANDEWEKTNFENFFSRAIFMVAHNGKIGRWQNRKGIKR